MVRSALQPVLVPLVVEQECCAHAAEPGFGLHPVGSVLDGHVPGAFVPGAFALEPFHCLASFRTWVNCRFQFSPAVVGTEVRREQVGVSGPLQRPLDHEVLEAPRSGYLPYQR